MKKIIILFVIFTLILSSFSFADTFRNITYKLPKNHYISTNTKDVLQLNSNDISSSNNIVININPAEDYLGYVEITNDTLIHYKTELKNSFVDSAKNLPNSTIANSWGISETEYSSEIIAYKNSLKMLNCEAVELNSIKAQAIKYLIYSEIFNYPLIQVGYCIPNGNNYYFITFTGDYTDDEINSFLNTLSITGFVTKNDNFFNNNIVQAFLKGALAAVFLGIISFISTLFNKKKKTISSKNSYIYDPSLTSTDNLKKQFEQMDISALDNLIKNQKEEYTDEAYNIALEQYKIRSMLNNNEAEPQCNPDTENSNPIEEKKTTIL